MKKESSKLDWLSKNILRLKEISNVSCFRIIILCRKENAWRKTTERFRKSKKDVKNFGMAGETERKTEISWIRCLNSNKSIGV